MEVIISCSLTVNIQDANGQDANFNYHTIRAVDRTDPTNLKFEDTSFTVNLGNIEIKENATSRLK